MTYQEWGPWLTVEKFPHVGQYIQIDGKHKETGKCRMFEGIVAIADEVRKQVELLDPQWHEGWAALRWREKIVGSYENETREVEVTV